MIWSVHFDERFEVEFAHLPQPVQDELLASAQLLSVFGP